MKNKQVFLNGEFLPIREAKVSVLDRGFLFGDGVYEVIPAYGRKLFCFSEHMQRFDESLAAIRLSSPYSHSQLQEIFERLIESSEEENQYLYCQITRGAAENRDHTFPKDVTPSVFAMSSPFKTPYPEDYEKIGGIQCITYPDNRWLRCDIKAICLLANILARQTAVDEGMSESIFIRDGFVTEGAATNLFIVKDGSVITPAKNHLILGGITRNLVVQLLHTHHITVEEKDITVEAFECADEVWLTSSTKEIMPVTRVDKKLVGNGNIGPLWTQASRWFKQFILGTTVVEPL